MADLFALDELVSYLQVPEFDTATAALARELATTEIRFEVGASVYDALLDLSPFKPIALAVARRVVTNPSGLRSSTIDDYSETYASESLGEAYLTGTERDRIRRILRRSAAFTIQPATPVIC